jgi:hypothetical protein
VCGGSGRIEIGVAEVLGYTDADGYFYNAERVDGARRS